MEKLSGIIPSSRRVKSVDLDASHPTRPGAPSFGAPVGTVSSVRDRVSLSGQTPEDIGRDTLTYKNPKEAARSKMVDEISQRFFDTRIKPKPAEEEPPIAQVESQSHQPFVVVVPISIEPKEFMEDSSSSTQSEIPAQAGNGMMTPPEI